MPSAVWTQNQPLLAAALASPMHAHDGLKAALSFETEVPVWDVTIDAFVDVSLRGCKSRGAREGRGCCELGPGCARARPSGAVPVSGRIR